MENSAIVTMLEYSVSYMEFKFFWLQHHLKPNPDPNTKSNRNPNKDSA